MKKIFPWNVTKDEVLQTTRIFTLRQIQAHSQQREGVAGNFVYLDIPNWVNVIAITPQQEVLLIEQYRHGNRQITLEIPGGMCDGDEDFVTAGCRELLEETGYAGENPRLIGTLQPNPAIQNNECATILVENAILKQQPALDPMEEIRLLKVPLADIPDYIRSGTICNGLVIAAFHYYRLLSES